jgi:hypothetical protein
MPDAPNRRPGPKLLLPEADAEAHRARQAEREMHKGQLLAVLNAHYLPVTGNILVEAAVEELSPKIKQRATWEFPELVSLVHEWFMARAPGVLAEALEQSAAKGPTP